MSTGNEGPQQGKQGRPAPNPQRRGAARTTPPRGSRGRSSRQIEERRRAQRRAARRRLVIGLGILGIAILIAVIVGVAAAVRGSSSPPPTVTPVPTASTDAGIPPAPLVASLPTAAEKAASARYCAPFLSAGQDPTGTKQWGKPPKVVIDKNKSYQVKIYTDKGTITADILPKLAPITANNFVFLACNGFYNNLVFHRTVPGFVIQGGDPKGTGAGGPGYQFQDEKVARPYEVGDFAMANSGPNTNGSQFFIILGPSGPAQLTPQYNLFGHVIKGQNVADAIANAPAHSLPGSNDPSPSAPNNPVHIRAITLQVS